MPPSSPRRKRFGQHFLRDAQIINRMIAAIAPTPSDRCVEIGPGRGALTGPLLSRIGGLDVIELDRDLARDLAARFRDMPSLRVHTGDALEFDFTALADEPRQLRVVGNLPYNISTPLLFRLFEQAASIRDVHMMLQREVVDRLVAPPGGPGYGRLSVMARFHCRAERLFSVTPDAFLPPPRVHSAVVRMIPHPTAIVTVFSRRCFERVVRCAFSQRRKTLRNSLRPLLTAEQMGEAGVDPSARAETLDIGQFAALANRLSEGTGDPAER